MENPNNENPENTSKIENPEKMENKQKETLSFYEKKFIQKKIKSDGLSFVDNFGINSNSIYEDFEFFLNSEQGNAKDIATSIDFSDTRMKEKILSQLRAEALRQTMPMKKTMESVNKNFLEEYNLKDEDKTRLKQILEKLDIYTLKNLAFSQKQRQDFLIGNGFFKDKQEASENFAVDLSEKNDKIVKNLNIDISKLPEEQKELVYNIVASYLGEEISNIYPEDLANLFAYLDNKSKLAIIKLFRQNSSYKELIDLGLYNENELKSRLKNDIIEFYRDKLGENIDEQKAKLLLDKINLDDYVVNINDNFSDQEILENFFNQEAIKDKIGNEDKFLKGSLKETIAKKIASEIDELNKEIKKEKYEDEDHLFAKMNAKNCNGKKCELSETPEHFHKDFIEFIKSPDSGISAEIREQIENLQKNNFVILEDKDTKEKTYYKISEVDFGKNLEDKKLILKDITAIGGIYKGNLNNSNDEIREDGGGNFHRFFYNDFYNTLKVLSNPNSKEEIKIVSENDFKNLGVEEVDEDSQINSKEQLIKKISREALGKSGIDAGNLVKNIDDLTIIRKGGDKEGGDMPFQIINFDDRTKTIKVRGGEKDSKISYNVLYEGIKKEPKNWDLIQKIKSGDEVLSKIGGDYSNLKVGKDNLFEEKGNDSKKYNFFRNEKSGVGIEITKLKDNEIEYTIGNFNSKGELKKDNVFYKADSFDKFFLDVKKYELKPSVNISEALKKDEEDRLKEEFEDPKAKYSKLQGVLGRMSIMEIGMAFKKIPETLKHRLQKGNELSSARLAVKMGKLMGDTVYYDLKAQFASEENKIIEEMVSMRKNLGTKEMLATIEKRVINTSNAPRYEVEAAMTVLLEKYGSLYPKEFHKYRGSWLWYKKFGGSEGDKLFREVETECAEATTIASGTEQPVPFTEEVLLEKHLKNLDKNFPFRVRPRADKALAKAKNTGIADGRETGNKKASDMPTAAQRIIYALGLIPGEEAEFIGALEKIFPKYGSASDMHAVPFVLTASGIAKDFDPAIVGMLKSLAFTTSYPELAFNATKDGIKKYQNFVVESARLKFGDGKAGELEKIINLGDKEKRVKKLREFWEENGVQLIDTLLGNDGLIIQKAEKAEENSKDDNAQAIQEYIKSFTAVVKDNSYGPKDDDLLDEFPKNSGIYTYVGALDWKMQGNIIGNNSLSETIFDSYIENLNKIKNLKDEKGNPVPENIKKKIFKKVYKGFETKISKLLGVTLGNIAKGKSLKEIAVERNLVAVAKLMENGLDIFRDGENERGNKDKYNDFLDNVWDSFYNFTNINEINSESQEKSRPQLEDVGKQVATKTSDIVNKEE